jgi:hypothetical protein
VARYTVVLVYHARVGPSKRARIRGSKHPFCVRNGHQFRLYSFTLLNTTETSLTAATFAERLSQHDVGVTVFGDETVRLVTHKNVSRDDIDATVRAAETVLDAA